MTISVVLIDDHTLVRQAVAGMLDAEPQLTVVGQAGSIAEATGAINTLQPRVCVVDVSLPDGNGLKLVRHCRDQSSTIGLVVLTMYDDDATLISALDAGASAVVLKTAPAEAIVAAVLQAAERPLSFSAEGLSEAMRRHRSAPSLTVREKEVLQELAHGQSVAGIAKSLYMSESTVKTHITKLYSKLGAHNRASAVMAAVKLGLVGSSTQR